MDPDMGLQLHICLTLVCHCVTSQCKGIYFISFCSPKEMQCQKIGQHLISISADPWPSHRGCHLIKAQITKGPLLREVKFLSIPTQFLTGQTMSLPHDFGCCPPSLVTCPSSGHPLSGFRIHCQKADLSQNKRSLLKSLHIR